MDLHQSSIVRHGELEDLLRRVASPATESLVIRGPAGMGKSTLLRAAFEVLKHQDVSVRFVRPTEAEQHMPFTALVDLLAGLPEEWYNELPPPQRRAVRTALCLDEADEEIDPRAVAAGLAGVVARSGYQRPIVILVDDAQWLDAASRTMIVAALRRIRNRRITMVAATRPTEEPIDRWLPGAVEVIDLQPLGREQMQRLLLAHLGEDRGPAVLRSVVERSGGNPLFAVQIARGGASQDGRLDELISRQVMRLPFETRQVLLTASLAVDRSLDTIAKALSLPPLEACERLDPARTAGLVRTQKVVRFEHPLYAEAVIALAAEPERRRALEGLAMAEPDPDARIAHRAAVTACPDDDLAAQLDEAAANARRRGAWDRSLELLREAVSHTSAGDARLCRSGRLGEWLVRSGQPVEGEELLREVYLRSRGPVRHRAALALAELFTFTGRPRPAAELVIELQESDASPELRARSLLINPLLFGDRPMLVRAERAERILADAGSSPEVEQARTAAMTLRARCLISAAQPADDVLAEAVAREGSAPPYAPLPSAAMLAASHAHWNDRYDEAEVGYGALIERALDAGDEESLPILFAFACCNHARHGRWDAALRDLETAHGGDAQRQVGAPMLDVLLAWVRGHTGELDAALDVLDKVSPLFDLVGPGLAMYHQAVRGELLLGAERYDEAARATAAGLASRRASDMADPGLLPLDTDWMEAAVALGDLDGAEERLITTTERAKRMGRENVLAACERVRVLLLAGRGETARAVAAVPGMLAAYDASDRRPLDAGRAYLAAGEALRRARAKRGANEHLARAEEIFASTGHETYRLRAVRAMARFGGRAGGPAELTGSERRTAELAISGLRNREIAVALFVDVKTVESTLTRVYRKLGIRSRVELARALEAVGPARDPREPAAP